MEDRIIKFISEQTCASICCADQPDSPYCFSCVYAFDSEEKLLYYKSSAGTRHSEILLHHPAVAGTILPDKLNMLHIKGIQFEGIVLPADHPFARHASARYYKKHPLALTQPGSIWTIQLNFIKFTDSSLGFGKKITWNRQEEIIDIAKDEKMIFPL